MVKLQLRLEAARSSHSSRQGNSKSYYCSVQGLGGGGGKVYCCGKASATSRGSKIKSFIKTGKQ